MACCEHHKSWITYGAIALTFITMWLSIVSPVSFITGLVIFVFLSGTCCCKYHRIVIYLACILALICAIFSFIDADERLCPDGTTTNCNVNAVRALSITNGVLWLIDMIIIFKIPVTSKERRNSGSPGTFNQSGESA